MNNTRLGIFVSCHHRRLLWRPNFVHFCIFICILPFYGPSWFLFQFLLLFIFTLSREFEQIIYMNTSGAPCKTWNWSIHRQDKNKIPHPNIKQTKNKNLQINKNCERLQETLQTNKQTYKHIDRQTLSKDPLLLLYRLIRTYIGHRHHIQFSNLKESTQR